MIRFFWALLFLHSLTISSAFAEDKKLELKDLGFASEITKPDEQRQLILTERTHKLKLHEVMGPVTWALMTATLLTAEEHKVPTLHKALGIATAASYFTTAYLSLSAPEDPQAGEEKTNLKIHKTLAWVHFPLMIATPIVGFLAQKQINKGEQLHGIAAKKGALGVATYAAFTAAFSVMLFDF